MKGNIFIPTTIVMKIVQDRFQKHHEDVKFILQANGIHDDPYRNFPTHEKGLGGADTSDSGLVG